MTNTTLPSYRRLRDRAEAVSRSIHRRALAECRAAGLQDAGHLHNALVGYARGRPWREVDYSRARRAAALYDAQFAPTRWLSGLYQRRGPNAFAWD